MSSAVELPSNVAAILLVAKVPRKVSISIFFTVASLASAAGAFTEEESSAALVAGIVAKFGITGCFILMYLFVSERDHRCS